MTASAAPAGCEITGEPDRGAEKCKGLATEEKREGFAVPGVEAGRAPVANVTDT
jgi:hypothetical protein